jgi:hypothetical protein
VRERVSSMAEGVRIEKSLWVCYNIHRSRESEKEMRERDWMRESGLRDSGREHVPNINKMRTGKSRRATLLSLHTFQFNKAI